MSLFCSHFKYLGSWVPFLLRDDHYVAKRIASANASMGAMTSFWDNNHVDVYSSTSCFEQFHATCFYGAARVGISDRLFWVLLKYSYTEV